MSSSTRVVILGAGAAGSAAARRLADSGAEVVLVDGDHPTGNRTLVNKGVAVGLLEPEQTSLPMPEVTLVAVHVGGIDVDDSFVTLVDGRRIDYDALVVATGSTPARLDGIVADEPDDRITTLHSLADAVRVRDRLAAAGVARVLVLGAGLIGSETASLLAAKGHAVTLASRSTAPAVRAFGAESARRVADAHRRVVDARLGSWPTSVHVDGDEVVATFPSGDERFDLCIVAIGAHPTAPHPFTRGVEVDANLRSTTPGIYAAGGVATHDDPRLGRWRIDHWSDAVAQGEHVAAVIAHDLLGAADPGTYVPRSAFTAQVHDVTVAAAGLLTEHVRVRDDADVHEHLRGDHVVGVSGVDTVPAVFMVASRLPYAAR